MRAYGASGPTSFGLLIRANLRDLCSKEALGLAAMKARRVHSTAPPQLLLAPFWKGTAFCATAGAGVERLKGGALARAGTMLAAAPAMRV